MNFHEGMRRLAVLVGLLAAIGSFVAFALDAPGQFSSVWWAMLIVAALIGLAAWVLVRAISWAIQGFWTPPQPPRKPTQD